jgi:long-chain fatty acid transport protein
LEWPDNTGFRATEGEITYLTLNPVLAWKIHPTLMVGAGLRLNQADAELKQTILPAFLFPPGGQTAFKGDGNDIGFNAGVLWKPHPQHSFGLTYFSATRINLEGDSTTSGAALAGIPSFSQSANARFQFPQHIVAGWSFRPTTNWNFEVNVDWTDWDSLDTVTLNQAVSGPVPLPFNWQSSLFYEFGVTRYLANDLRVSAGYIFSENSVPDQNFNPLIPDSDRHIFSVGIGGQFKKIHWDAAYQFAYGPERSVANNVLTFPVASSANGKYEFESHAIALALRYGF